MGTRFSGTAMRTATAAIVGVVALAGGVSEALAAGPGPGKVKAKEPKGCAEQCITKAWLSGEAPTLALEVKTKVPAKIKVQASAQLPLKTAGGPEFPSVAASASTGNQLKNAWTSDFGPVKAGTTYHVVAWATDKNGNVAYQQGTVTTPPPPPAKDSAAGGALKTPGEGCALQCITKAKLNPTKGSAALEVRTAVPARLQVRASKFAPWPTSSGPHFNVVHAGASTGHEYRSQWTADLTGLEPATKYHVVVSATDERGKTAYQQGTFSTHDAHRRVSVSVDRIHVISDADRGKLNRGELELYFAVGDWKPYLHQNDKKVKSGRTYGLPWHGGRPGTVATVVEDAPQHLTLKVQGVEHDKYGKGFGVAFCSQGIPPYSGSGGSFKCGDYATATTTLDLDSLHPGLAHVVVFETRAHHLKFKAEATVTVQHL